MTERLPDSPPRHAAVRAALSLLTRRHGGTKVRDVADAVDLSERRLVELFTAEVGLTPKLFGRIQRFQRAVALSRRATEVDWAQIALDCGYYDQSHLIRDFVAFAGVTPCDFLRRHRRLDRAGSRVKRHHLPLAA